MQQPDIDAPILPPFRYNNVLSRVLALKAEMNVLQDFCDQYLNLCPHIVRFEPVAPYVQLMILNYGSMTSRVAPELAVFSQNEVFFQVPVRLTYPQTGRSSSAVVCPYIFVDNDVSAATGRELYGWPKERAWLGTVLPSWSTDPRLPVNLARVQVNRVRQTRIAPSPLVEVTQGRGEVWLNGDASPIATIGVGWKPPWANTSKLPNLIAEFIRQEYWFLTSAVQGLRAAMAPPFATNFSPQAACEPLNVTNAVNLKQFADAEEAGRACYQSITNTPIAVERMNSFGLIGTTEQLLLDSSGGLEVRVFADPTRPIVEKLGLQVDRVDAVSDEWGGSKIYCLKPIYPFWMDSDLIQQKSTTIAWRSGGERWQTGRPSGVSTHVPQSSVPVGARRPATERTAAAPKGASRTAPNRSSSQTAPYNRYLGRRLSLALGSPLKLGQVSVRYMKLATEDVPVDESPAAQRLLEIQRAVDGYTLVPEVNRDGKVDIYALVYTIDGLKAGYSTMPWWNCRAVEFCVPTVFTKTGQSEPGRGLTPVFSYANNAIYVHSVREMFGGDFQFADINPGPNPWLNPYASQERRLLDLRTITVPELGVDDIAKKRELLQVLRGVGRGHEWGQAQPQEDTPEAEHHRKHLQGLVRPLTAADVENTEGEHCGDIQILRLKQIRRADDPEDFSYRALVCNRLRVFHWLKDEYVGPLSSYGAGPRDVHIRLHDYASPPIRQALGLKSKPISALSTVHEFDSQYTWFRAPVCLETQVLWEHWQG